MKMQSELLARFFGRVAFVSNRNTEGYPRRIQICMVLDQVAGEMMDQAFPTKRAEIYQLCTEVKRNVLKETDLLELGFL